MSINHTQPESQKDFEDRRKVASLCSTCIVRLFEIMSQLEQIRDILEAIDVPELSSYKKVNTEVETVSPLVVPSVAPATTFVAPKKQDLTSIAMSLAKNLENRLKSEGEKKE